MTSCTIIISHYESLPFLRACVRQIKKHEHPEVKQTICICDQSSYATWEQIGNEYGEREDMILVHTDSLYSGFGIDYCMRHIYFKSEYICQVHTDIVPVSKNWLYLPIKLIEEHNFSFVGQLQFIAKGTDSIYPPNPFFAMAQCFNVARKETYEEMSKEAGFTRFHNRIDSGLEFNNSDWADWAQADYFKRGSDDDVVAFHWEDTHREHDKLGLAITGFIEAGYGRLIEDLVFHFGSCREAQGVMAHMPQRYQQYTQKINENYSDALIEEMVSLAKANKPNGSEILSRNFWNGATKESSPPTEELNKRIEELKNS